MDKNYTDDLPLADQVRETPESFGESSNAADFNFRIIKNLGTMSQSPTGWAKEINLVSWNGNKAKYDIRDWSPEHEKMTRGIRLTSFEAKKLRDFLCSVDLDRLPEEEDI